MTPLHLMSETDEAVCELLAAAKGSRTLSDEDRLVFSIIVTLVRDVKELKKQVKDLKADVGYMQSA